MTDAAAVNSKLNEAIRFASDKHAGQLRKGTVLPYIVHPMETMTILYAMNADIHLLMAGVLHDTVEDTDATVEELTERFGPDVSTLVNVHSEDKSKTWKQRKTRAIRELEKADRRLKLLVMADKVSNLRSMAADYRMVGGKLWERFKAPREKQAWYYSGIQDALWDMQTDPDAAPVYWEMVGLYKDIFVEYYRSVPGEEMSGEYIVQVCAEGSVCRLDRGCPEWKRVKDGCPEEPRWIKISRREAESLEDEWNRPFWTCIGGDLRDGSYPLVSEATRFVSVEVRDGALSLHGEDYGPVCEGINGKEEYEYCVTLDRDNTKRLLVRLRMDWGIDIPLEELLLKTFGTKAPSTAMMRYCKKKKADYCFISF